MNVIKNWLMNITKKNTKMKIELTEHETEILMELLVANVEQIEYRIKMKQLCNLPIKQALWDLKKANQKIINKIVDER